MSNVETSASSSGATISRYERCATPIQVGSVTFKNRITRTAHGTGYTVDGKVTERLIAYHEARARGGVGSVILETAGVHPSSPGPMWAFTDDIVDGWAELAERLHRYDVKAFPQLWHAGAQGVPPDGGAAWAASSVMNPITGRYSQTMTQGMIDDVVEGFAAAARRAQRAGLDGVEVHAAHTYLVCSFLSPATNFRDDRYGGSFENRLRFPQEILRAIRRECGDDFVVGVRLAPEATEGGIDEQEAARIRRALEDEQLVDFVDVSLGGYFNFGKMIGAMHEAPGYELPSSATVTADAKVPTIVTGRILTLAQAEEALASGAGDIVSMVRALLADPELVAKSFEGREAEVRPCIGCNEGCVGRRFASGAAAGATGCTVNPLAGLEYQSRELPQAGSPKKVLVVGAGPAGLEAARTAALRGHEVVLHEAGSEPGGVVSLHRKAPFRDEMGNINDWLWSELERLGVERHLDSTVDVDLAREVGADAVIVATGARARVDGVQRLRSGHHIDGLEMDHVVTPIEVLDGSAPTPRAAVVFDDLGNYQAIGSAELLLERGSEVHFVTSFGELAPDLFRSFQRDAVADRLRAYERFHLSVRSSIERVTASTVVLKGLDGDREHEVDCDLVVLATGFEPRTELAADLQEAGFEVQVVGDAKAPLLMPHAIASGYEAGATVLT